MQDLGQDRGSEAGCAGAAGFGAKSGRDLRPTRPKKASRNLEKLIETQILPRLLAARRRGVATRTATPSQARIDVEDFVRALLQRDEDGAWSMLRDRRRDNVGDLALMLELFAPAARRLGVLWEQDLCDFLDVTVGLTRLEAMLAELSRETGLLAPVAAPRLLLLPAPGETHLLGADMAVELFRREGWDAQRAGPEDLRLLATRRFDAIGFSISCERLLPDLLGLMNMARELTSLRRPAVLLGGALFANPSSDASAPQKSWRNACESNADFVAGDAAATLRVSAALLERRRLQSL